MTITKDLGQNRSVSVGGSVKGSVIQTGDQDTASLQFRQVSLPDAESVDIRAELAAIKQAVLSLSTPDRQKIQNAFQDAEEELAKQNPDKDEVGRALDRALDYAKKAEGFAGTAEKLTSHITNAAAWLGENWHKILGIVSLVV